MEQIVPRSEICVIWGNFNHCNYSAFFPLVLFGTLLVLTNNDSTSQKLTFQSTENNQNTV